MSAKEEEEQQQQQQEEPAMTKLKQDFTFWFTFFKKTKDKQLEEFEDNLKPIGSFNTAEEFWGIYQHMKRPNTLPRGCEFFLFKKGIKPLWEDIQNVGGGRFYLTMKKGAIANKIWEDLLIAFMILDDNLSFINGVVLNVRTSEVFMSIWTKSVTEENIQQVKEWMKETLDLPNEQIIEFKKHPNNEQLIQKQEVLIKEEEERQKRKQEFEKQKEDINEKKKQRDLLKDNEIQKIVDLKEQLEEEEEDYDELFIRTPKQNNGNSSIQPTIDQPIAKNSNSPNKKDNTPISENDSQKQTLNTPPLENNDKK